MAFSFKSRIVMDQHQYKNTLHTVHATIEIFPSAKRHKFMLRGHAKEANYAQLGFTQ